MSSYVSFCIAVYLCTLSTELFSLFFYSSIVSGKTGFRNGKYRGKTVPVLFYIKQPSVFLRGIPHVCNPKTMIFSVRLRGSRQDMFSIFCFISCRNALLSSTIAIFTILICLLIDSSQESICQERFHRKDEIPVTVQPRTLRCKVREKAYRLMLVTESRRLNCYKSPDKWNLYVISL